MLDERRDLRLQFLVPVLRALPSEIEDVRRVLGHRCAIVSPQDLVGQTELLSNIPRIGDLFHEGTLAGEGLRQAPSL